MGARGGNSISLDVSRCVLMCERVRYKTGHTPVQKDEDSGKEYRKVFRRRCGDLKRRKMDVGRGLIRKKGSLGINNTSILWQQLSYK